MRWMIAALAFALVVPFACGQGTGADAEYKKLSSELKAAQDAYSAKVRGLQQTDEYKKALAAYRKARASERQEHLKTLRGITGSVKRVDMDAFKARYNAAAKEHAGADGAVPFLVWLATRGSDKAATKTLLDHHLGSPKIGPFMDSLQFLVRQGYEVEDMRRVAGDVIEKNPHDEIKAAAHYARAQTYLTRGRTRKPIEGHEADYAADVAAVGKLAPGSLIAKRAAAPEFERTRLQIGMTAPEIMGADMDGTEFKLSDYRGKVVVIDFWGDW